MPDSNLLSIVIVSWNTRELLARCLESVYAYPPPGGLEVYVVDNGSTDGSADMVAKQFPQVRLIRNPHNPGFASANNQAIRQSCGRYVLLLNPDTVVYAGALRVLIDYLETHPQIGAVGPRLLNPDSSLQTSCYPAPTLSRELWRLLHLDRLRPYGVYQMADWDDSQPREVDVLLGACLLTRQTCIQQIGMLDEDYFMYSEEVDFCYRLQAAGLRLAWVPQAEVVHYGGQSTGQVVMEMFLRLYQGKVIYFRKHHGPIKARLYKLILALVSLPRLLSGPIAYFEPLPRRQQHLALAHRYRKLLNALPGF